MKPRHIAVLTTAAALTTGMLLTPLTATAGTGNRTCPPVTHKNTDGWTTAAGGMVALHASKGIVLKTGASNDDKVSWIQSTGDVGVDKLGQLAYQTETVTGHNNQEALPGYVLRVDLNDDGTNDTHLMYEPYWNTSTGAGLSGKPSGSTTVWDVDGGVFWSSTTFGTAPNEVTAGSGGPPFYTLTQIKGMFPAAVVTGYGINLGTYNQNVAARVNDVRFGCVKHEWLPAPVQPTGTPTGTATGTPSATPTGSPTKSPTGSPSVTPSGTKSPTASASVTPTGSVSASSVVIVPAGNGGEALPVTGSKPLALVWVGLGLLAAGVVFVLVLRSRRTKFTA